MRVVQTIASVDPKYGGPSFSVPGLCAGLAKAGAQVELHTVAPGAPPPSDPPYAAFQYSQDFASTPLLSGLRLSSGLAAALNTAAREADIIHAHGLWLMPNVYPARAVAGTGTPLVLSPRGMLSPAALDFSLAKKRLFWTLLQGRAARAARCIHATSDQEYEDIRRFGLTAPVAVIPNGIDVGPEASRRTGTTKTVLSLGRIHPKKGLDRLVRAWAKVEQARPDWRLQIVGNDELDHANELRALGVALGLSRMNVEGPVYGEAKTDAYADADLFVLPTLSENFAMTVAEALAAGVPAISTKGAPWAGLDSEGCGWWIDHGVEPMEAALLTATGLTPAKRTAMGARGRAWMARDFSWDSVAARMIALYGWLAHGAARPDFVRLDQTVSPEEPRTSPF